MEEDDLAATPASGPSLTPPSPRLAAVAEQVPIEDVGSPARDLDGLAADAAPVDAPLEVPGALDALFGALDRSGDAILAEPRRGRRIRAFEIIDARIAAAEGEVEANAVVPAADLPAVVGDPEPLLAILDDPQEAALAARAKVPRLHEDRDALVPVVHGGYAHMPMLAQEVHGFLKQDADEPKEIDANVYEFLKGKAASGRVKSLALEASDAQIDIRTARKAKHRWAACFLFWLHTSRLFLGEKLASLALRPSVIYFFEWMRYDETPMEVRTQESLEKLLKQDGEVDSALKIVGVGGMDRQLQVKTNSGANKILQSEQLFGVVLHCAVGIVTWVMDFPSPLVLVESTKAATMLQALARLVGTTAHVQALEHKGRGVCVDGHPSNRAAERLLQAQRKELSFFIVV